jgi:RimJ/RimL family protein N-acetyltransferase
MNHRDALLASITTARLVLRAPLATDRADIVAMANSPKMLDTTATLPHPFGDADALDLIAQEHHASQHCYAIAGVDDRFMGVMLFKLAPCKAPEVGYWLGEPHWGQGYAAEALNSLLAAVRNLPSFAIVTARVLQANAASVRVLEKAGFSVIEHTFGVVERHRGKPLLVMQWSAP